MNTGSNLNGDNRIRKIMIIGGGSSGMMAAAYLTRALRGNVDITLVESRRLGRIGVGEATIPTIKTELFDLLGIPEHEWMPKVQASFKLGIRYANWRLAPEDGGDHYYHSFGEMPSVDGVPASHLWHYKRSKRGYKLPMDYACYSAPAICDQNLSPRYLDGTLAAYYAYHFDALLVAEFLRDWAKERGLNHIYDDLTHADLDEDGNIARVHSGSGKVYEADLFIDCSGFAGFLIDKALGEPVIDFGKSLLTDSAVAINIPNDPEKDGIRPYSSASAMKAGWMWEIPLVNRSGNGYVYSSDFISADQAEAEIRAHFGDKVKGLDARHIRFRSYRRRRSWVKNVVSLGLASSFLEPLESTGLYFVYAALYQLVENFPGKHIHPAIRNKFNERVSYMVDDVKDFIIMHFCTSPRTDTAYWLANKHDLEIPDSLQKILDLQRAGLPIRKSYLSNQDTYNAFEASFDRFWTNSNYQSILMNVDYLPEQVMPLLDLRPDIVEKADEVFRNIEVQTRLYTATLPSQYDYLMQQAGVMRVPSHA